mgnify:CR=1 FL=1
MYRAFDIDVATAIANLEFEIEGSLIKYKQGTRTLKIKLNHNSFDDIWLHPDNQIEAPFKRFYLSCDASDEQIRLLVSDEQYQPGTAEKKAVADFSYLDTFNFRAFYGRTTGTGAPGQPGHRRKRSQRARHARRPNHLGDLRHRPGRTHRP